MCVSCFTSTLLRPRVLHQHCPCFCHRDVHLQSNISSPSLPVTPRVLASSQGPLHDGVIIQAEPLANYPTCHPYNSLWNGATAGNRHSSHFDMVSEAMGPSTELPSQGTFVNVSVLHYHQGVVNTLNHPPPQASGSDEPEQGTTSTLVAQQGTPGVGGSHPFECEDCHRTFDRLSRLDNCLNRHRGIKPYKCGGRCDDQDWFVSSGFFISR